MRIEPITKIIGYKVYCNCGRLMGRAKGGNDCYYYCPYCKESMSKEMFDRRKGGGMN